MTASRPATLAEKRRAVLHLRLRREREEALARQGAASAPPEGRPGSPLVPLNPAGTKPPLFLVHAAGGSVAPYVPLAPLLGDDQPVHALEDPGLHGAPTEGRGLPELAATYLAAVREVQPDGPLRLGGWSVGGAVALEIALRFPERVKTLTVYEPVRFAWLFDARLRDSADEQAASQVLHVGRSVGQWVHAGRQADAAQLFIDYWSGAGTWSQMDARRREGVIAAMPKVAAEFDAAFNDGTPLNALLSLSMPLCFMGGDASPQSVQCIVRLMGDCAPHARREFLRGAGHMAPVTHAQQLAERLPRWLRVAEMAEA